MVQGTQIRRKLLLQLLLLLLLLAEMWLLLPPVFICFKVKRDAIKKGLQIMYVLLCK